MQGSPRSSIGCVPGAAALACILAASGCTGALGEPLPDAEPADGRDAGSRDASTRDARPPEDAGPCPPDDTEGLALDGVDDHVRIGPVLGLARFTIEAWVRRDGAGTATTTGAGGLEIVPIAAKGCGAIDGVPSDCDYALGFVGDVLAADFQDAATGANHPVRGTTSIPVGGWHHVAASYDGTALRVYLDGALEAELATADAPRADGTGELALGSAGLGEGALHGALDEVRVWDRARTGDDIAAGMYQEIDFAAGLVARWSLGEIAGAGMESDAAGAHHGTVAGGTIAVPGAPLAGGAPPIAEPRSPADGTVVPGTRVDVEIAIEDPDTDEYEVTVLAREIVEADDFTIAVMPDTQYYADAPRGWSEYFHDQTRWISANRVAYNIVAVIHNGDVVEHGNRDRPAWVIADAAMDRIEVPFSGFPHGLPYGISVGNHDQSPLGTFGGTASFNEWFGIARFRGRAYYGGHYGSKNDESWFTFSAGGLDFVVVNLQYDTSPDAAIIRWARGIFLAHPDAIGILNSHYILGSTAGFSTQGRAIYEGLKDVDNLQLMTCGHVSAESRRTDTYEGNVIHSMLADYQGRTHGGDGWMRIWEFSPADDELTVRTYSPSLNRWETDANSEFTLPVELPGMTGEFVERGTVDATSATVTVALDGLVPDRTYEWYATVRSCGHTTRTRVATFVTAP